MPVCELKRCALVVAGVGVLCGWSRAALARDDGRACARPEVTLTFRASSSEIDTRARSYLNDVVSWLREDDLRTVRVEGYGGERIGERRAEAARRYLVSFGIAPSRIETLPVAGSGRGRRPDRDRARAVAVTGCEAPRSADAEPPAAPLPPPPRELAEAQSPELAPAPAPPPQAIVSATPPPASAPPAAPARAPRSIVGVEGTVGGGVTGFVGKAARGFGAVGGSWDVRVTWGSRLPVSLEAAYVGSAQPMQGLDLQSGALLVGNGAEAAVRINLLAATQQFQPYIFGGVGWINYQVENTQIVAADLDQSDNVLEVPLGIGISGRLPRGFVIDVRATGRATFNDSLFNDAAAAANVRSPGLSSWNLGARLGWEL
jgi:hypothetical protein